MYLALISVYSVLRKFLLFTNSIDDKKVLEIGLSDPLAQNVPFFTSVCQRSKLTQQ